MFFISRPDFIKICGRGFLGERKIPCLCFRFARIKSVYFWRNVNVNKENDTGDVRSKVWKVACSLLMFSRKS